MTSTAICVPVYEAARPFLAAFTGALIEAAAPHQAQILLVIDDLASPEETFSSMEASGLNVTYVLAGEGSSPAKVRAVMLSAAAEIDAEILVFSDCDDMLEAAAVDLHLEALNGVDFSYGDQILVDATTKPLGSTLFQAWNVPDSIADPRVLLNGNFIGFSGSAIRRRSLTRPLRNVPNEVMATDWWVFNRLLYLGARGRKTRLPVVRYRQWDGNIHGGSQASPDLRAFSARRLIVERHFAALEDYPEVVLRRRAVDWLGRCLSADPTAVKDAIEKACERPDCWYADVIGLALMLLKAEEKRAR